MNVAVIGSGGREHALAYKILESKLLEALYVIPGNPGTKSLGENVEIELTNFSAILQFCINKSIELVIIGPEQPLVIGLADFLRTNNILVFGPNKAAAEIEGDKSFAKNMMKKYGIPTADFEVFNNDEMESALKYLNDSRYPIVIKASGLAAGKGVVICNNYHEAEDAVKSCFENKIFGDSGNKIIIEEYLEGQEISIFAITDGKDYVVLPAAQDHKQIYDGDKGPNTGGMGAYSPVSAENIFEFVKQKNNDNISKRNNNSVLCGIEDNIVKTTILALMLEKRKFNGCLYCGLMITKDGPKVIEYNCRFGDPETQAVLMTVEGDFLQLLHSTAKGCIEKNAVKYNGGASVCVVAVSNGYPGLYKKGFEILGLNNIDENNTVIFHAGTKEIDGKIFTNGGRVISIASFVNNADLKVAKSVCYEQLAKIDYTNIYYRNDISDKAI